MGKIRTFTVETEEAGRTIGSVLKARGCSKREISNAKFTADGIRRNGKREKINALVSAGDRLEICLMDRQGCSEHLEDADGNLVILYEDEDFLVVDKPAGMAVHPSGGHYKDTLANLVASYLRKKGEATAIRAVGRLDLETSGIVVFARNRAAAARLSALKGSEAFQKEYTAFCMGHLAEEEGRISIGLEKEDDPASIRMRCSENGKPAETFYQVLETFPEFQVVRVVLTTGRTHQIRCHFAGIGHPLLGDRLYGRECSCLSRTALHAGKVRFCHPFTGEWILLTAKLPEDLQVCLKK